MIYVSSLTTAEILPSYIIGKKYSSYKKFLKDMDGAVTSISPSQNIFALPARFRDIAYTKLASKNDVVFRRMDVPDAVMLATAVILRDGYGVPLTAFHTYDRGKKRSVDGGKCVPLLDLDSWCERLNAKAKAIIKPALDLNRTIPIHPKPDLPGV